MLGAIDIGLAHILSNDQLNESLLCNIDWGKGYILDFDIKN